MKKGGYIAVAISGLKHEFGEKVPDEMKPFLNDEAARTIRSIDWWKDLWQKTGGIDILTLVKWLVANDIKMMNTEGGKYFNLIQLIAKIV